MTLDAPKKNTMFGVKIWNPQLKGRGLFISDARSTTRPGAASDGHRGGNGVGEELPQSKLLRNTSEDTTQEDFFTKVNSFLIFFLHVFAILVFAM